MSQIITPVTQDFYRITKVFNDDLLHRLQEQLSDTSAWPQQPNIKGIRSYYNLSMELNKVLSKIRLPGDPDEILKAINLLTGLDQKLKLNITSLKNLTTNADNIKTAIKNKLTNIIASKIKDAVAQGVSQLKKYF